MIKQRIIATIAVVAGVLAIVIGPRVIRNQITKRASQAGVTISFAKIYLKTNGVELRQVTAIKGGITANLDKLRIIINHKMQPVSITAEGGILKIRNIDKKNEASNRSEQIPVQINDVAAEIEGIGRIERASIHKEGGLTTVTSINASMRVNTASIQAKNIKISKNKENIRANIESAYIIVKNEKNGTAALSHEGVAQNIHLAIRDAIIQIEDHKIMARQIEADKEGEFKQTTIKSLIIDDKFEAEGVYLTVEQAWARIQASADSIETSNKMLTDKEIRTGHINLDIYRAPDHTEGSIKIGQAKAYIRASIDPDHASVSLSVPPTECQSLFEAAPPSMVDKLTFGTTLGGSLAMDMQMNMDLPARHKPEVKIRLKNECRITRVPETFNTAALRKPFKRTIYDPKGRAREIMSGPGTEDWTPLSYISKYMSLAIRTTEDPGFWAHRGFSIKAIEDSIADNIRAGRFARGASTVTMQLAKNLWLYRQKTLARKLQELILTMYLEQSLSKEQILELYLNIVELGPDVYGIGQASLHYFNTIPTTLSISQAVFLATILPHPVGIYFGQDKKLSPGRLAYVRRIIQLMFERKLISEEEYKEGMEEEPIFGSQKPQREGEAFTYTKGIDPSDWN